MDQQKKSIQKEKALTFIIIICLASLILGFIHLHRTQKKLDANHSEYQALKLEYKNAQSYVSYKWHSKPVGIELVSYAIKYETMQIKQKEHLRVTVIGGNKGELNLPEPAETVDYDLDDYVIYTWEPFIKNHCPAYIHMYTTQTEMRYQLFDEKRKEVSIMDYHKQNIENCIEMGRLVIRDAINKLNEQQELIEKNKASWTSE